ncbi:hypothetical protein RDI58_022689 [Solanum bulbocastanum]|uniref:Uncharacterized protein n=1 Tax=Solanum bulbocastanum TaxID=147425 RepID=A0AAN8Y5I7_SOLBU
MWSADVALNPCYVVAPFKRLPTRHSNPVIDEEIVGCGNDIEKVIQYLSKGKNELDVIPIVGIGDKGKRLLLERCTIVKTLFLILMFKHGASFPKHITGEHYYKIFLVKLSITRTREIMMTSLLTW